VRRSWQLPLALLVGLAVRVPFWIEALRTPVDGDTAIVGLMARHPMSAVTFWGQPYGSPLDAVVAMPFVAAFGNSVEALRLPVFLLGLCLIAVVYLLARALHEDAALPAALLMACPPAYFLLMAALPQPFYATTLVLCGLILWLGITIGRSLELEEDPRLRLVALGVLAGLALWTHLMSASAVAASLAWVAWRATGRRRLLLFALIPLLACSSPWWARALVDRSATRMVSVSGREQSLTDHLLGLLPRLQEPIGGVLGTHVPVIPDAADHMVGAPRAAAAGLILGYGILVILALRACDGCDKATPLLVAAGLALLAFPFPVRAGPHTIRFLTPLFIPIAALVPWVYARIGLVRRAYVVVLALACLQLLGGARLLEAWRSIRREEAPFLLPNLEPVRRLLEARGLHHAYASYGPAYRLTWESGERIVASQPWNERFRHYPLPLLDEVRFAKDVAWVLTPSIPTDIPAPAEFEAALGAIGGDFQKAAAGQAVVYYGFVPPYAAEVEPLQSAGAAGDGNLATALAPDETTPTTFVLPQPRPLDGITLVAPPLGSRLLRSMDVAVSPDGTRWQVVASRRRRAEREDLRWVNGHPQYVLDHDLLAVPLGGRTIAAIRISPYASGDAWAIAEILLHPARPGVRRTAWGEWLQPGLSWAERRTALRASPHPDREDWYWRCLLAERN
jgi:hypothetical protein